MDADALNSLAKFGFENAFENKKCEVLLTPHLKEFSRLCRKDVQSLITKGIEHAQSFAKEHGGTVLLKNAVSLITNGNVSCLQVRGNAGLAKAGSGDVLTGIATALMANGLDAFNSAKASSYILGICAELFCRENDERSMLATDAIETIGKAILAITEDANENSGND